MHDDFDPTDIDAERVVFVEVMIPPYFTITSFPTDAYTEMPMVLMSPTMGMN